MILFDGLSGALLGQTENSDGDPIAVYCVEKCVEIFRGQGMEWDDAVEWFEFNVRGTYAGPLTPIFVDPIEPSGS